MYAQERPLATYVTLVVYYLPLLQPIDHESMESLKTMNTDPIDLYECFKSFVREEQLGEEECWLVPGGRGWERERARVLVSSRCSCVGMGKAFFFLFFCLFVFCFFG